MSGSVFDAVVLLVSDGLVAVGRVLGGFRRRSGWERQADALAVAEESRECWEPDELWAAAEAGPESPAWVKDAIADAEQYAAETYLHFIPEPVSHGFSGQCPNVGRACNCTGECLPKRSAAVTVPAADNTTQADRLEAAFNYHKGAVGYAAMRAGGVEWFCEGCSWSGPTKQAHARHRFQVLADMSAATGRVNEQLGGGA